MWFTIKRLSRGIVLIVAAAGVLLAFDARRGSSGAGRLPRVAILQQASTPVLDDGVRGMLDGLAENGYRDGETVSITTYNAQGEAATANAIAREITAGGFDLVLTSSTPSLQAVANVNRAGRVVHVFGLVADPYVAGVGLDRADPFAHPRHMVGYGLLMPVGEAFRIARRMLPALQTVGVAWNPAESNARMYVGKAREACQELRLTLLETQVDNSAGVREATQSLVGRGAQVLWVGGDVTVSSAIDTVVTTARQAHIPVFSILPGHPDRGTLFDRGVDFHEAGLLCGKLAAQVLNGADPAAIPIRESIDLVPRRFYVNEKVLKGLREPWRVPVDLRGEADVVVDDTGIHRKADKDGKHPGKP